MTRWQFRSYISDAGVDLVREWFEIQDEWVQAEFGIEARYLRETAADEWQTPGANTPYRTLQGDLSDLGEIRIKVSGEQYRLLGFRDVDLLEFTMLMGVKKVRNFNYKVPGNQSLTRMGEVLRNRSKYSQKADWIFDV